MVWTRGGPGAQRVRAGGREMSSQVIGQKTVALPVRQAVWPVRLGVVPPLAGSFSPRPETGLGLAGSLVPGETTILCPAADGGTPDPLAPTGGTGKTQLAAALAHSLWQAGAVEVLVWLTASRRDAVIAGYAQALHDIGAAEPGAEPGAAAARFLAWLASTSRPCRNWNGFAPVMYGLDGWRRKVSNLRQSRRLEIA